MKEFIYGGYWSSLAIPSIIFVSSVVLKIPLTWDCLLISYLGYHALRMYNRYREFKADVITNPERSAYLRRYYRFLPIMIVSFSITTIFLFIFFSRIDGLAMALLMAVFGFLYTDFFKKRIKVPGFKAIYVAFWWSLLPLFVSIYYNNFPINSATIFFMSFIFSRLLINVVFFDIKDVEADRKEGVITIPVAYGIPKTLKILWFLNVLSLLLIALGILLHLFDLWNLMFFFLLPYTYYFLKKGYEKTKEDLFLYYVVVDGEQIFLWPLLILPLTIAH